MNEARRRRRERFHVTLGDRGAFWLDLWSLQLKSAVDNYGDRLGGGGFGSTMGPRGIIILYACLSSFGQIRKGERSVISCRINFGDAGPYFAAVTSGNPRSERWSCSGRNLWEQKVEGRTGEVLGLPRHFRRIAIIVGHLPLEILTLLSECNWDSYNTGRVGSMAHSYIIY